MIRRLLDSPWLYFGLAGLLLVAAVASLVEVRIPSRPKGDVSDIRALQERDDLNVIFILIDTLRADRLSAYGYERETSPVLQDISSTGVRFAHVKSQSSWTKCSMASLWTGVYPQRTGVLRAPHAVSEAAKLPAEIFKEAGFTTAGIWRNGWVANNFGFAQGFDTYYRPTPSQTPEKMQRRSPGTHKLLGTDLDAVESAIQFVDTHRSERFFLYMHLMDVHQYIYDEMAARMNFGTDFSGAYDGSIHWTDRVVGLFLQALDERDMLKNTLIVINSDHGEGFYEHGTEGHARTVYREVTEVPLIFMLPFLLKPGIVVEQQVANVDVWPTILDLVGLDPMPEAEGRSLVPLMIAAAEQREMPPERPVFAQIDRAWGRTDRDPNDLIAVVDEGYSLMYPVNEPEKAELYNRRVDPKEQTNLAEEQPEKLSELENVVKDYIAMPPVSFTNADEVELDEMRLEQLRALGYVVK